MALAVAVLAVLAVGSVVAGALAGYLVFTPLVVVPLVLLLAFTRRRGRAPAGPPWGGGPTPPGGAGVREPRRPRPVQPAGSIMLPLPDDESPAAVASACP
jgi:hypothetical protein